LYGTDFQIRVWKALTDISYGATAAYRDVAIAIGAPKAVRAVGGANNRNPIPVIKPCHRVIGASGELVGYGGGLHVKTALLELEGYPNVSKVN
jgi:methylated-DNA-[protein]-cysteine S-methyltransferase